MGDYKASWASKPYGAEKWQLFNIMIDPGETNDISAGKPQLKQKLINEFEQYAKSVGVVPLKAEYK